MSFVLLILRLLPKRIITAFIGKLAARVLPKSVMKVTLWAFTNIYKVNTREMHSPLDSYRTLNEFFTRPLKSDARPINSTTSTIVSPVDGTVITFGEVVQGQAFQIKGLAYPISALIAHEWCERFLDGLFVSLYLSPGKYHRIHTPYSGKLVGAEYHRGALYPVNNSALRSIRGLFTLNERICSFIESSFGLYAMVKVAALNVGNIETVFPQTWDKNLQGAQFQSIQPPLYFEKGEEFARFKLGSTVILFFEKGSIQFSPHIQEHSQIHYGQELGILRGHP